MTHDNALNFQSVNQLTTEFLISIGLIQELTGSRQRWVKFSIVRERCLHGHCPEVHYDVNNLIMVSGSKMWFTKIGRYTTL